MARISYNGLWKLLIDKNLKKLQLRDLTGIGTSTLAKLSKNEPVRMEVLARICDNLHCRLTDIIEIYPGTPKESEQEGVADEL
ncbi:MAG: helix-turn-helix transcriptional regulator [Oscillospiraceae bacterium]